MCETTATSHKNNLLPSSNENQINQIKQILKNTVKNPTSVKKSNQSIKANMCPKGSCFVIGDSMLEGFDEPKMSSKSVVKLRKLPGATTDMY